ncbi:glutamate synthase-related protein [Caldinitratiruptor microaerophilus]|nr:glutamate synthase-related protein [Caldinitratiruptor microaerophilus]
MNPRRVEEYLRNWEHDACALLAVVHKDGEATRGLVDEALEALVAMAHRSGDVDGEGDGCGIQTDIPRALWARVLAEAGQPSERAFDPRFAVGHFLIPRPEVYWARALKEQVLRRLGADGATVLVERSAPVDPSALGPQGRLDEPEFWQVAVLVPEGTNAEAQLFRWTLAIEEETPVHVVSFSTETAVYKVRGGPQTLRQYFGDLGDPNFATRAVIGHNRYSTNTSTAFERVQPFHLLGHNGEINTIRQLREQTEMLGIPLTRGGSDSQDLDRLLMGLLHVYGLTLAEAMEMVFPPVIGEIKLLRPELQDLYMYLRQAWGPFAQGPAAVVARAGAEVVASVDAMGLRPLWLVETEDTLLLSSEPGVVPFGRIVRDPKPLAPGEKVLVVLAPEGPVEVVPHHRMQDLVLERMHRRVRTPSGWRRFIEVGGPPGYFPLVPVPDAPAAPPPSEALLAAMGWSQEDHQLIREMAAKGSEPIGSLGYDGPLACLSEERQNLADFFKETVAVVTNPAIDREREIEHFSTRVVLGARPPFAIRNRADEALVHRTRVELRLPVLLGGHTGQAPVDRATYRELARAHGTYVFEDLLLEWDPVYGAPRDPGVVRILPTSFRPTESLAQALARLGRQAVSAVLEGAELLVLDDTECFRDENLWIDPHLAVSTVDLALKRHPVQEGQTNFRRRVSIVLRSGAIRNLHDLVMAIGLGADAVNPYLLLEVAAQSDPRAGIDNILSALHKGLEKVISTLGIHELRGYARLFSSIGLKPEVAKYFDTVNYCGSEHGGLGLARLKADAAERYAIANGLVPGARMARTFRIWPRLWKALGDVAAGRSPYRAYAQKLQAIERETPVSLRHLLDLREQRPVDPAQVDTTIEDYAYPITISGMSFGSQGEVAFRAYAEAAKRLDIVCMNGEGGEIPDMVGRYFKWRGQQVASGRFGVHARMLAGSRFMEIKIGQGAKPGEGGHLPGKKVTEKVARARNAVPGIDLISPSNNHDIYSIEDLAQIVEELHTVNPRGKVVVKVPVVPGIGTIAVGIAKSGADVIALCGYDGGTGAARKHALRHAGLPIEIGVREAHLALTAAGVRGRVEIWADSGMKSGLDVVKLILLGANRVGFGTLAMVAAGCTACRGCHLDTCHVGIATQIESVEEARERGLKHFVPREFETAVQHLVTVLGAIGEEVRELTARLGFQRTQDMVGRAELLQQVRGLGQADLRELTMPTPLPLELQPDRTRGPVRRVTNPLAVEIAALAHVHAGSPGAPARSQWSGVTARDRILGTALAGELARGMLAVEDGAAPPVDGAPAGAELGPKAEILLEEGSLAGHGLGAFNLDGMRLVVRGGAQDGVGKGMLGGEVIVLKGANRHGKLVGGSVGKSFAYGAQGGLLIVQGDADARCGIRLSGADVIIGGRLRGPIDDSLGLLAERANLKGFAFEYMTRGRAVVLGDPGPWLCSGMTGGVVYVLLQPELGLDEAAIRRRLAKGARVNLAPPGSRGKKDLTELLGIYHQVLLDSGQSEEAAEVLQMMLDCERRFIAILPVTQQVDPSVATE